MRLWSLHPQYLDTKGLLALWREGLLAQAVLLGKTKGYTRHPQLFRFRQHRVPHAAIATYLRAILNEADSRGYRFDPTRIGPGKTRTTLPVTQGQLNFEWQHLRTKLRTRDPQQFKNLTSLTEPQPHPLFHVLPGPVEPWEKGQAPSKHANKSE